MKPKSAHRYRICGTPVRTGCITCKIRRVKCGEEKPFCKRCTSTGRKCDGYAPPNLPTTARKTPPKTPLSEPFEDPMEQRILHFFSTVTASKFSGNYSADFWERRVLQAIVVEPCIRHAAIAIGAVHYDFISRHDSTGIIHDPTVKAFAFRQYTKAISYLQRLMATMTQKLDFTLISCILFICFDCVSGNHDRAIIHLKAGLKILEDIQKRNAQASSAVETTSAFEWEKEFAPLLLSLGVQAASFVNPKYRDDRSALWSILKAARIPTHPTTFHSLDEARHALETTMADILSDRTATEDRVCSSRVPDPDGEEGKRHAAALERWSQALNRYLETPASRETSAKKHRMGVSMLKVHSLILSIVIDIPKPSDEKFQGIIQYCEGLVPDYGTEPLVVSDIEFSADIGIICPLFFTALRAPQMHIRQRALELLSRAPRREGMWDSDDAVLVAGQAIQAVRDQEFDGLYLPKETPENELRLWHDISLRLQNRFTWPFAGEEPSIMHTSFMHGSPFTRSDPDHPAVEPDQILKWQEFRDL